MSMLWIVVGLTACIDIVVVALCWLDSIVEDPNDLG